MTPFWDPQFVDILALPPSVGWDQAAYPGAFAPRWPGDWAGDVCILYIYMYTYDVAYYNVYIYILYVSLDEHHTHTILLCICALFFFSWIDFGLAKLPSFHHQASVSIFIWSVSFCSLLTGCELEVLHAGIPYIYIYVCNSKYIHIDNI